jgi:DNA-binding NarL/FixJ family response regulator
MEQIKVVLVDDHGLVRAGIKGLINQLTDFIVVAEAPNPAEAMRSIASAGPDIVVTDITMGAESGLDLVREVKQRYPTMQVVILSMHASEELAAEALRLGASAYLLKEAAPQDLEVALRAVMRQETYLSPAISAKMIARFVRPPAVPKSALQLLTPRQSQILAMIADRKSTKQIAYELDLSEKTIAAHRAQLMERIGARNLVELVLFAVKHGLVNTPN